MPDYTLEYRVKQLEDMMRILIIVFVQPLRGSPLRTEFIDALHKVTSDEDREAARESWKKAKYINKRERKRRIIIPMSNCLSKEMDELEHYADEPCT